MPTTFSHEAMAIYTFWRGRDYPCVEKGTADYTLESAAREFFRHRPFPEGRRWGELLDEVNEVAMIVYPR